MNLTPEQLLLLQQGGNVVNNGGSVLDGSRAFNPIYGMGSYSGADNYTPGELLGYQGYDFKGKDSDWDDYAGQKRDQYNAKGEYVSSDVFQERDPMWQTALTYAAILASAGAAGSALAGAGMGAGAGGYGASAGALESGIVGAGAGGASGGTTFAGGIAGAGGAAGAAGGAAGGGGLLSSLTSGLTGSGLGELALKYGPGLLGALAGGSSGNEGSNNTTKQIDPRLLPYIYGDANNKGAFGYAKGLLDAPVAPNAFEKFYGGR
jgi:hypothetical protein